MSSADQNGLKEPWYKRGWGILGMAFLLMILMGTGYLTLTTFKFYRELQLGELPEEIQAKFTRGNLPPPLYLKEGLAYQSAGDPTFGNPDAPVQIVEFADFECPYSREESLIIRELQTRFPQKIHFIYRDFPLEDIHPKAFAAAEAANCAHEQGKFWPMHDKLFQNANRLSTLDLKVYALEIGLDLTKFNDCFDKGKYKDEIAVDRADGLAAGVEGTPTFFINGRKVKGAIPLEVWEQILARVR